jgi:prepilin-type N-terminal cleavage/methylation domain-containing protein
MQTKNAVGFTLLELMIGLIIMGMMARFAVPELRGLLTNYRLNNAAKVVWFDLHRARMLAIRQRTTMQVNFTTTAYNVVRSDTGAVVFRRNLSGAQPPGDYPGITVSLSGTAQNLSFTNTGALLPPSQTVQIQGPTRSKSFTVILTGRIGQIS